MNKFLFALSLILMLCYPIIAQKNMENEIIKADKEMSALAQKVGFFKALSEYADENFVKLGEGSLPIIGKKEFDSIHQTPGTKDLSWTPLKAEVAKSGELGYSWGNWVLKQNDTNSVYGNYFTIWKKNKDGIWKMLLDGGNTTPDPNKK